MFANKLVAVINKDLDMGVALNAVAHMSLGLARNLDKEALQLDDYVDANANIYPNISRIPYIILRAKSGEIRKTIIAARERNICHTAFLNTMTGGTYIEQLERTKLMSDEEMIYYGCALFGAWEVVSEITRKFSLFR